MADTLQVVSWTLERTCGLRGPAAATDPPAALQAVSDAQIYSPLAREGSRHGCGIFGDIAVTGVAWWNRRERPGSGFSLAQAFGPLGGVPGLFQMCRDCPANTHPDIPAGCAGLLSAFHPESPAIEGALRRLQSDFLDRYPFPETRPLWYGLWIDSPLGAGQITALRELLPALAREVPSELSSADEELSAFLTALDTAVKRELPLHVRLAPPGHTDLRIESIFAHCPRCKALTRPDHEWDVWNPGVQVACRVCGHRYEPALTESSAREHIDDLKKQLGPERFRALYREFLLARGKSPEAADQEIRQEEADEDQLRLQAAEGEQARRTELEFMKIQVFDGLSPNQTGTRSAEEWLFTAADFGEVLRRCTRLGIGIRAMFRNDSVPARARFTWVSRTHWPFRLFAGPGGSACGLLKRWQEEGLRDRFGANYAVPSRLLEKFQRDSSRPQ